MARPRKSSTGKTSFGKRSDAEKSFRNRKKEKPEGRYGEERSPRSKFTRSGDGDPTPRFSRSDTPTFRKRDAGGAGPKRFDANEGTSPFRKKSFSSDKLTFRKGSGGFAKGAGGFERKREDRFEKRDQPFKRKGADNFDESKSNRFNKKPFDRQEGGEKPAFRRKDTGRFDSRSSGPSKFPKKPFDRSAPKEEGEKSYTKGNYGLPYKRKPYNKLRDVKSSKRIHVEEKAKTDSDLIRLNKFIANSGVGSRREADELIKMGLITVNGEVVTEMGHKVKITDEVRYEGRRLKAEKPVYVLLNKPKGFITTTDDPQERNTVMSLVASAGKERIYPVGRLDRNTTGLLLLTNDGDLADKLTHPSYNVKKIYRVELDKPISKSDFQKITDGVYLEEGKAIVDDLAIVEGDNKVLGIELHIGWNRIVRRIFESLGYQVVKLDRVVYAGLDKKDLNRGEWRFLKPEEIVRLKHFK